MNMDFVNRIGIVPILERYVHIIDSGSILGIFDQHRVDEVDHIASKMTFYRSRILVYHKIRQSLDCGILERMLESGKVVEKTAQSPNVDWE